MIGRGWLLSGIAGVLLAATACGAEGGADKEASSRSSAPSTSEQARTADGAATDQSRAGAQFATGTTPAQSAPVDGSGAAPDAGGATAPSLDRKVIYNVTLDLVVKDVQASYEKIAGIAETSGGLIADSSFRQEKDQRRALITIRVPSARHQEVLAQLRGMAVKVESETSKGSDVTEEFSDLDARRRNLEAAEQQLLVLQGQARNLTEVFQVQDRLNGVRAEIEKIKGRLNLLGRLSDLATIQAQLRPDTAPPAVKQPSTGPGAALRAGWDTSLDLLGGVAIAAAAVAGFSWWLAPLALAAAWFARRELRARGGRRAPAVSGE